MFVQPNARAVALNRVLGADPSVILGSLSANGKVFLVDPNGIMFGKGAQVNVGGLVASTLGITDGDFMTGRYAFSGSGGTVLNEDTINADGGYVALLGASVGNDGVIQARFGTVALAAGDAITLDVAGDGLLNVTVDTGAVNALVRSGGIRADGGQVLMTAQAAGQPLKDRRQQYGRDRSAHDREPRRPRAATTRRPGSERAHWRTSGRRIASPAGRFIASHGHDLGEQDIVWVDYAAAISLHGVVTGKPSEARLLRLATASIRDNRISYGCINVPAAFYDLVVQPIFSVSDAIVYILPETRSVEEQVFPHRAERIALASPPER